MGGDGGGGGMLGSGGNGGGGATTKHSAKGCRGSQQMSVNVEARSHAVCAWDLDPTAVCACMHSGMCP